MDEMETCLIIIVVVIFVFLGLAINNEIKNAKENEVNCQKVDNFIITDMEYEPAHTTMVMSGKVLVPIHHSANWIITYDDCEISVKEETYNKYKIGDILEGKDRYGK